MTSNSESHRSYLGKPSVGVVVSIRMEDSNKLGHCMIFRFSDNKTFALSTSGDCCLCPQFQFSEDAKYEIVGHRIISIYEENFAHDSTKNTVYIVLS
jgi:hypothetical protein